MRRLIFIRIQKANLFQLDLSRSPDWIHIRRVAVTHEYEYSDRYSNGVFRAMIINVLPQADNKHRRIGRPLERHLTTPPHLPLRTLNKIDM